MDRRCAGAVARARRVLSTKRLPVDDLEKTIWGSPAGKKRIANRLVAMLPAHKNVTHRTELFMNASRWWLVVSTIVCLGAVLGMIGLKHRGTSRMRQSELESGRRGANMLVHSTTDALERHRVLDRAPSPPRATPEPEAALSSLTEEQRAHIGPMLKALEQMEDTAREEGDEGLLSRVAEERGRIVRGVKGLQK